MLSDACVSVNCPRIGILGGAMSYVGAPRFASRLSGRPLTAVVTVALLLTSACVSHVPRYQVLPGQGQSSETLDRDRYECGLQAQKQTNYDPGGSMTAGALTGLIVGGALGAGLGASAVLPALSREWALGDGGRAGLTIAVQAGFILGTLGAALANLPDIVSPRALMGWSALAGAALNAALALWVESLVPALVLRFATGLCMAGAYPPAMKIVATWFRDARGLAIGILVGALTVGSAAPHLIRGVTELPWRGTLLAASALALGSALVVWRFVRE